MKRDQYIPHEVSMRSTTEVMNLIEKEGPAGYGIYWALMEYLRVQDGYIGDIQALKPLKRQLKIRQTKLDKVLHGYGLFVCNGNTFYSPKLNEVMKPFEQRRAKIEAYKRNKEKENSLEISDVSSEKSDIVSFEVKGKGEGKGKVTTSKEEKKVDDDVVVPAPPVILAWERYVDELANEQQWIEVMAMRSGLGLVFVNRFPEVLKHFKLHVQAVGSEKDIQSPSDAKRYFCFYNTPGSTPFRQLVAELQKPIDKGKYKHEDYDPATGQRSYCGVPIPADAPPRPNAQAVWNEGNWVY
jgi:hypothetical protein